MSAKSNNEGCGLGRRDEALLQPVKVSKRYQVGGLREPRYEAGIKPGDVMVPPITNGVLQYVPVRAVRVPGQSLAG